MPYLKPQREFYIPKGATKFADRNSTAVVYAYENDKFTFLLGFHGRAQKPDFHFRYGLDEKGRARREAKAKQHFASIKEREGRARNSAKPRTLKVGDVLRASWGYDQTNIDFYQVTALIGKAMVEIREIRGGAFDTDFMTGQTAPMVGDFMGKPMRKVADGDSVKIASYSWAYKLEPTVMAGVPTYESSRFSTYA